MKLRRDIPLKYCVKGVLKVSKSEMSSLMTNDNDNDDPTQVCMYIGRHLPGARGRDRLDISVVRDHYAWCLVLVPVPVHLHLIERVGIKMKVHIRYQYNYNEKTPK